MENEEKVGEEVEFDSEKREELKKSEGPYFALQYGEEMGVPQSELERFLSETVEKGRKKKKFGIEFTLRTTLNKMSKSERWGSPEEIRALGERVYQEAIEADDLDSQVTIAEVLFGEDSPECLDAIKRRNEAELGETDIRISIDATLADVFGIVNRRYLDGVDLDFENKLREHFDQDLAEAILSNQKSDAKMFDLFDAFGYSKEDIETYLPIKFV